MENEFEANWLPGNTPRNDRRPCQHCKRRDGGNSWMVIGVLLVGMFFGYILGLWHQAAQRAHRENCASCRAEAEMK
jgi:hypothetical protein